MQTNVLVLDIGSTRLKAAFYAQTGEEISSCSCESPLQASVVQADDVLMAVQDVFRTVSAGLRPDAIAITCATRTHVLVDADGTALGPIVKLDDARGSEFEHQLQQAYRAPGERGMGAFHPIARLLHAQATQPVQYGRARWHMELKDWLNLRLTGVAATDLIAHARIAPRGSALSEVMDRLGLRDELLAPPMEPATILGPLVPGLVGIPDAWAGVPIVQCGFDAWCASYGMGCVHDGHVYNVSGTTEVFGSFSTANKYIPGVPSLQWTDKLCHLGGPCLTGLSTLAWFGRTFLNDSNPQGVLDCAASAGADSPLCLPFVNGERTPFWRADLAAQFLEVRSHHGVPEFARGLLDGLMAFQHYLVGLTCPVAETVYLSGGATALHGWSDLKAAMFAKPLQISTLAEPSLLGGAMAALAAVGQFTSIVQAQHALVPPYLTVLPSAIATSRIHGVADRLLPHLQQLATS